MHTCLDLSLRHYGVRYNFFAFFITSRHLQNTEAYFRGQSQKSAVLHILWTEMDKEPGVLKRYLLSQSHTEYRCIKQDQDGSLYFLIQEWNNSWTLDKQLSKGKFKITRCIELPFKEFSRIQKHPYGLLNYSKNHLSRFKASSFTSRSLLMCQAQPVRYSFMTSLQWSDQWKN